MITRPTKKELKAALTPMRKAAERYAINCLMNGHKTPKFEPTVWRGFTIEIEIVRRNQVVCNVPVPYCAMHFYYKASRDGKAVAHGENGTMLVDNLFRVIGQGGYI